MNFVRFSHQIHVTLALVDFLYSLVHVCPTPDQTENDSDLKFRTHTRIWQIINDFSKKWPYERLATRIGISSWSLSIFVTWLCVILPVVRFSAVPTWERCFVTARCLKGMRIDLGGSLPSGRTNMGIPEKNSLPKFNIPELYFWTEFKIYSCKVLDK